MRILKYLVIFLVVCSVSFISVGLVYPTVSYQSSVIVNRPITHTFNAFTNPFYLHKWLPGFVSITPISGMPYQPGSIYELVVEHDGEEMILNQEMTGFEVNRLFSYKLTNEFLVTNAEITFAEVDGKTKITSISIVEGSNILIRSVFPFMQSTFQKRDQEGYDNLKDMIEGNRDQGGLLMDLFFRKG